MNIFKSLMNQAAANRTEYRKQIDASAADGHGIHSCESMAVHCLSHLSATAENGDEVISGEQLGFKDSGRAVQFS